MLWRSSRTADIDMLTWIVWFLSHIHKSLSDSHFFSATRRSFCTRYYFQLSVCDEDENLKPCTLFDEVGVRALFAPFHTHPLIPIADVPDTVKRRRQLFLEKCVTMLEDARSCYRERWTTIVELASDWHLDVDALRIKVVCSALQLICSKFIKTTHYRITS